MSKKNKALGKGLDALFENNSVGLDVINEIENIEKNIENFREEIVDIKLDELRPNPYQPRKVFKDTVLNELADSIKIHGVFQPIIVKKSIKGYEIIAGERRFRASKLANKETIPAIVRTFTDEQMMEVALLENIQRENLTAIEEAMSYRTLIDNLGLTQEKLAQKVGKSRSHITNMLGLLNLSEDIQEMVLDGSLSMGHARVLSKMTDRNRVVELAQMIVKEGLSVRETEKLSKSKIVVKTKKRSAERTNIDYTYAEELLRDKLGTKVKIKDGKIAIDFTSTNDLNRILEIIEEE